MPAFVEILKQLLSRQIATVLDDACEPAIADLDRVALPALAAELEVHLLAANANMPVAKRRQAERIIALRILLVADADQALLEQLDDGGKHFFARQACAREIGARTRADLRQRSSKRREPLVLRFVPHATPLGVIA